jgi:hypothetical protein
MGRERETLPFGFIGRGSKGLEIRRRPHLDMVNAFVRQSDYRRSGFGRVCNADTDSIDRLARLSHRLNITNGGRAIRD